MKRLAPKYLVSLAFVSTTFIASANVVWPSLYLVQNYFTWYVILVGLAIETGFAKFYLKTTWLRSLLIMLAVNAISALVGIILIPLSGLFVEIILYPFGGSTFDIFHIIFDLFLAILINAWVEGLSLKLFKYSFDSNFWWLLVANAVSVIVGMVVFYLCFILSRG